MIHKFFRILDSSHPDLNRWHLSSMYDEKGKEIDERIFTYGRSVAIDFVPFMTLHTKGHPLGFTLGPFDVPIVHRKLGEVIQETCPDDVQRFPVSIQGAADEYEILNVVRLADCLDANRSDVMWWSAEDGRPEKVGQPRMVLNLHIDPRRSQHYDLFRIATWEIALICSRRVMMALQKERVTGIRFAPVD